jgi:ParB family chromosome partitioning protein
MNLKIIVGAENEMEANLEAIKASPYQPRYIFNLDDLESEIKKDGLLNDLVVRRKGAFYELIDGERRWRVLKKLGWKNVPVRVVDADDEKASLLVYKLNKIRENYSIEEEARYFKKLTDEGMTPLDISKQLNVDFHWVLAHLNIFKFPDDIQKAVWAKQISVSHIIALESVIERNIKEAVLTAKQILERKLTVPETRKLTQKREEELKARVDEMRIKAVEKALPTIAPKVPKLETPEELEKAAEALKGKAMLMREGALTPEEITKITTHLKGRESRAGIKEDITGLLQTVKSLREKIQALEKEKENLLQKKGFLTEALSFNCPHCSHSCVVYREGSSYWVE